MIWLVLGLVVPICIGRAFMLRTRPSQAALLFAVSATCSVASFICQVFPGQIDRLAGVVNLSDIMHHILCIAAMTLSLLFAATLSAPHQVSRRTLQRSLYLSAALMSLVILQWALDPNRSIESTGDAGGWQSFAGPFSIVTVLYNTYVIIGFSILVWHATIGAIGRFADRVQQWASTVMGCGLAIMGLSQVLIVIRALEPLRYAQLTTLYWQVIYVQTFVFSIGLLLPAPVEAAVKVVEHRRQLTRLNPLWSKLTELFPDAQLRTEKINTPTKLAVATTRRFVEIGDCLNRLVVPQDEVAAIARADSPERSLGRYLWSYSSTVKQAQSDGEYALALLPEPTSPDDDKQQILCVADGFRSQIRHVTGATETMQP